MQNNENMDIIKVNINYEYNSPQPSSLASNKVFLILKHILFISKKLGTSFTNIPNRNIIKIKYHNLIFEQHFFLSGAPTSMCHFHPSVRLSARPFVTHHISGIVHHVIIIFGTHV